MARGAPADPLRSRNRNSVGTGPPGRNTSCHASRPTGGERGVHDMTCQSLWRMVTQDVLACRFRHFEKAVAVVQRAKSGLRELPGFDVVIKAVLVVTKRLVALNGLSADERNGPRKCCFV